MADATIVFVHTGPDIPAYAFDAIRQAALFTTGRIVLVAPSAELKKAPSSAGRSGITTESLDDHAMLREFAALVRSRKSFRKGFWTYTTQRFFYVAAVAERLGLANVMHLENDVMLYADAANLGARLGGLYSGVAAPFANAEKCVPSLVFARDPGAWRALCEFILVEARDTTSRSLNDMILLAKARSMRGSDCLDALPVAPGDSGIAPSGELFTRHASQLEWIFDAAAIGQFLGGPDPKLYRPRRWHQALFRTRPQVEPWPGPGFINPESIINPAVFAYEWRRDCIGRRVPWLIHEDRATPIANLHVHCKMLQQFSSDRSGDDLNSGQAALVSVMPD
jgi:hypothetical protein